MPPVDRDNPSHRVPIHRNRTLMAILIAVFGFFLVWGVAQVAPGADKGLMLLADTSSAVLVGGVPLLILTMIYGWAGVGDALSYLFRKPAPGKTAADAATFFRLWAAFALASGFLATMVALIVMLGHMDEPARLGPGLAVAMVSQLYGMLAATTCIALAAAVTRRHNGPASLAPVASEAAAVGGVTIVAGTITTLMAFGILILSLSPAH